MWDAIGQPKHYLEPFFGSGAVLLARPDSHPSVHVETINDADGYVSNVWRALKSDPEKTAEYADWPVNHADLSARKKWLCSKKEYLLENLIADPEWYDCKAAGWWIWAAGCWIGSGLTTDGKYGQRPHLSGPGMGVHKIGKRPHLGNAGIGVHRIGQRPHLIGSKGVHKQSMRTQSIYDWFAALSARLRHVRVVCGDWTRVCGGNWQNNLGTVGIFFDPPYAVTDRDDVYDTDDFTVAHKVAEWASARGDMPDYRIVIAGYDEHERLLEKGWASQSWKTGGGYGNLAKGQSQGKKNCHREVLYFSPHCKRPEAKRDLFEEDV